jgi:hypothetical protein
MMGTWRGLLPYDGTQIGYRSLGAGPPLVCLPGGPGRASEYLGDLHFPWLGDPAFFTAAVTSFLS